MKFKLTFLLLIILSIQAWSQSKNSISIVYGTTANGLDIHGTMGDFGYDGKGGKTYGVNYSRSINNSFSLVTGLFFADDKVQLNSIQELQGTVHTVIQNDEIKLITVPVLAKFNFFKYLFADGGLLADFETNTPNNSLTTHQSGIGYELGVGAKYDFGRIIISVNPYLQEHAVIPFNSAQSTHNLFDAGFKFGLGYSF